MGKITTVNKSKSSTGKSDLGAKSAPVSDKQAVATVPVPSASNPTKPNANKSHTTGKSQPANQSSKGKPMLVKEGQEFDEEDLELVEGMEFEDFEDPEDYCSEDGEDGAGEGMFELYSLCASIADDLQHDGQGLAEILCAVRDSIDANNKCMLRIANELKGLAAAISANSSGNVAPVTSTPVASPAVMESATSN